MVLEEQDVRANGGRELSHQASAPFIMFPFSDRSAMTMQSRGEQRASKGRDRSPGECLALEIARVFSRPASSGKAPVAVGELLESGLEVERLRGEMNKRRVRTRKERSGTKERRRVGQGAAENGGP